MSGTRQKIQYSLALVPEGWGEAPGRGHQGTEPPVAKPAPERSGLSAIRSFLPGDIVRCAAIMACRALWSE
jgi:hypothetical protein